MIEFAGIRSDERFIVVEHYPQRFFPKRKYIVQKVPGRSGDIILPESEDAFENYTQPYSVFLDSKAPGLPQASRALAEWLLGNPGYHRLEDSYDPDFYRMAYYAGGEQFVNWFNEYGQGTLTFNCAPKRFYKSGEAAIDITTNGTKLYGPSIFRSHPIVRIKANSNGGTCTIWINHNMDSQQEFKIQNVPANYTVAIDTELHKAWHGNDNYNSKVISDYEQLYLPQECTISWGTNVDYVQIIPRWWTI